MDIAALAGNRLHYANPSIAIEGNHFVIHLGKQLLFYFTFDMLTCLILVVRVYPFTALTDLNVADAPAHLHSCISRKVYHQFEFDGINAADNNDEPSTDEDEDDTFPNAQPQRPQPQPRRSSRLLQGASSSLANAASSSSLSPTTLGSTLSSDTRATGLQRGLSLSSLSTLPLAIWQTPWVPRVGRYNGLFSLVGSLTQERVYEVATSGAVAELEVHGPNAAAMAKTFMDMIGHAMEVGDFTDILAPERIFIV